MSLNQLCSTFILVCILLGEIYALEESVGDLSHNDLRKTNGRGNAATINSELYVEILSTMSPEEVNEDLEVLLRKILKNGISGFIPPLDPLEINEPLNYPLPEMPGALRVNNLTIDELSSTGLSSFIAEDLKMNLLTMSVLFDLLFSTNTHLDIVELAATLWDILPIHMNGSLELGPNWRLNGTLKLGTTTENDYHLMIISSLLVDTDFNKMPFSMSNIKDFGGTHEAFIFNNILGEVTPKILNLTVDSIKDSLISSFIEHVNGFLRDIKFTPIDLLNCLNGHPSCPISI